MAEAMLAWAKDMLALTEQGVKGRNQDFEIQIFRIGDTAVVGLPGEVFVQYELQTEEASPFAHTIVLGYTNGCIGYVPTTADYPYGGYEVNSAYKLYGTQMIAPESEGIILEKTIRLLRTLK